MADIEDLLGDVSGFLGKVFSALEDDGIDVSGYELDHICYRVETEGRYEHFQAELARRGELLSEDEIGGRLIANYRLHEPIRYEGRVIHVVELPSPKPGRHYPEGLEHVEFVIGADIQFEEFMARYPAVTFNLKGANKDVNPDVSIIYDGFCVKFHQESLERVIAQTG